MLDNCVSQHKNFKVALYLHYPLQSCWCNWFLWCLFSCHITTMQSCCHTCLHKITMSAPPPGAYAWMSHQTFSRINFIFISLWLVYMLGYFLYHTLTQNNLAFSQIHTRCTLVYQARLTCQLWLLFAHFNQTPIYEWYVVRCYQKPACLKEIA